MKLKLFVLVLCLLLSGCTVATVPPDTPPAGDTAEPGEPVTPVDPKGGGGAAPPDSAPPPLTRRCRRFMAVEEKVGQLFFVRCPEVGAAADVKDFHLGGLLLFGRDFKDKTAEAVTGSIESYQRAARSDFPLPLLVGVDEEGGGVVRISSNRNLWDHTFASPQKLYGEGGLDRVREDAAEKCGMLKT